MVTFTYHWERDDGDISGASGTAFVSTPGEISETYTPVVGDIGHNIRMRATDGTNTYYSSWIGPIIAAPAATHEIYWGGYLDGDNTYEVYYPGARPGGGTWGDAPWDLATWDKFESNAGKTMSAIAFGQPQWWVRGSFDNVAHDNAWSRGAIPCVSYGGSGIDNLVAIAAGTYDTQLTAWANAYKSWGKPVIIRLWWEMNSPAGSGGWYTWQVPSHITAATYIAAWRHVYDLCMSVGATNMSFHWCPNYVYTDADAANLQACYPGDAYVDWTGFDAYNESSPSNSFYNVYHRTYEAIKAIAPSKPMMIGETSSRDASILPSGTKASWITDGFTNQLPNQFPMIKAVLWFNWLIPEGGTNKDYPIESSSSSKSAFASAIASSYYKSKFTSVPTSLAKVPIPS